MRKFFTIWEALLISLTIISFFTHYEFIKKDIQISYHVLPVYLDGRYQSLCEIKKETSCFKGYPSDLISINIQNFSNEDLELLQFEVYGIFDLEDVFLKSTSDNINNQYRTSDVLSYNQDIGVIYLRINNLDKNSHTVIELYGKVLSNHLAFGISDSTNNKRVEYKYLMLSEEENLFTSRSLRIVILFLILIVLSRLFRLKVRH
ncbi:hypothetical protein F0M16_21860 [Vibrio cholerae]|uniref:Uncharacterized protein n=1 Tax=Vibrio cholerae TaxID=666 RepID=A0A5Q6PCU4_VIBCL|nr:hypothetical protein [Vibrio cholerae]KAA1252631.1 hypothetical protein F0M16_21860 [Vibrio cholerae]